MSIELENSIIDFVQSFTNLKLKYLGFVILILNFDIYLHGDVII